jgi:hypothetical protein
MRAKREAMEAEDRSGRGAPKKKLDPRFRGDDGEEAGMTGSGGTGCAICFLPAKRPSRAGPGQAGSALPGRNKIMPTPEDYLAKADDIQAQLTAATNEADRVRLRRAHGAYLKLATHGAEAAERAAMKPAPRIVPEKPSPAAGPKLREWSVR